MAKSFHSVQPPQSSREFQILFVKALIALSVGVPLFIAALLGKTQVTPGSHQISWIVIGLLVLAVMWYSGGHFFKTAWTSFKAHHAHINILIALAAGSAWLYSMVIAIWPKLAPEPAREVYFAIPVMVIGLLMLGVVSEIRASKKNNVAVSQLKHNDNMMIAATKTIQESALQQITQEAQNSRAAISATADKAAAVFVPFVLITAFFTFMIWMNVAPAPRIAYALVTFMAVLLIACPCALSLAAPISSSAGISKAFQAGILFHSSNIFAALSRIEALVLTDLPPDTLEITAQLAARHIKIILLVDEQSIPENFACHQMDYAAFNLSAAQKAKKIRDMQIEKKHIAVIAGLSDYQEIFTENTAVIKIMMGIEAYKIKEADVIILRNSLQAFLDAYYLAKITLKNIKQNLIGAFIYNIVGLVIAAGVFYPLIHSLLSPVAAAAFMAAFPLVLILNAKRLQLVRPLDKGNAA